MLKSTKRKKEKKNKQTKRNKANLIDNFEVKFEAQNNNITDVALKQTPLNWVEA